MTTAAQTAHSFDLFALPQDYYDSPWPYFAALRDHDPVHTNKDGSVFITRHHDVWAVWRHPGGLVNKADQFERRFGEGPLLEHHTSTMLFRDPPDHDRLRGTVKMFFDTKAISRLQARIDSVAEQLVDDALNRGKVDFVTEIAAEMPLRIMCHLLGFPEEDRWELHHLGRRVLFPLNPTVGPEDIAAGHAATEKFRNYLRDIISSVTPDREAETVVGCLAAEVADGVVTLDEAAHMCIVLFNGGHETTTNLLSVGLHALIDQPDQLERWRTDPSLDITATDELLRYVSPLQLQGRRLQTELELPHGIIPAGTEVVISQASANHDDRKFENAEQLDVTRRPNPHIAFGAGIHLCIGRVLARMEASALIPRLLRATTIERSGIPAFHRNARFRGLSTLPISCAPRSSI
jgi:cytochrome P450